MADIPVSADRQPQAPDNPRHAVWIEDERGVRRITARNPGDETINVEGVLYTHTKEMHDNGPWIYTKVEP